MALVNDLRPLFIVYFARDVSPSLYRLRSVEVDILNCSTGCHLLEGMMVKRYIYVELVGVLLWW